jgi:DNA-binding GntR family transcriptional regulator
MDWEGGVVAACHKLASTERRMGAGERSQHVETWKNYDREFHRALIAACGSQVLLETHAQIYDRYLR